MSLSQAAPWSVLAAVVLAEAVLIPMAVRWHRRERRADEGFDLSQLDVGDRFLVRGVVRNETHVRDPRLGPHAIAHMRNRSRFLRNPWAAGAQGLAQFGVAAGYTGLMLSPEADDVPLALSIFVVVICTAAGALTVAKHVMHVRRVNAFIRRNAPKGHGHSDQS